MTLESTLFSSMTPSVSENIITKDPESLPQLDSISVEAQLTSITVSVKLGGASFDFDGNIFCQALPSALVSAPTSTDQMKTLGFRSAYSVATKEVNVSISELIPVEDYSVYCYVENVLGFGFNLSQVLDTRRETRTLCCRSPIFTQVPTSVYADASVYLPSFANPSTGFPTTDYTFMFSILVPPAEALDIAVSLLDKEGASVPAEQLAAIPNSFQFTPDSTPSGSFILTGEAEFSGPVTIVLTVTGPSAEDYQSSVSTAVDVRASDAVLPVPKLSFCRFADSGAYLSCVFDSRTNKGSVQSRQFPCTRLFSFAGDSHSTCSWVSRTTVRLSLPSSLLVGDLITLKAGRISAVCISGQDCEAYAAANSHLVSVEPPANPVTPTVELSTPTEFHPFDSLVVDATQSSGAAGRPWAAVSWVVLSSTTNDVSALTDYLVEYGSDVSRTIPIPTCLLGNGTTTLSLTLRNFFGREATAVSSISAAENPNTPKLRFRGPSQLSISPAQALKVSVLAELPRSSEALTVVSYSWRIERDGSLDANSSLSSYSRNPKQFWLRPFSLTPSSIYILTVVATAAATPSFPAASVTKSMTVTVVNGAVTAVISGATDGLVSTGQRLSLDGSFSTDGNFATPAEAVLSFRWSCRSVGVSSFGASCDFIFSGPVDSPTVVVQTELLAADSTYVISLAASADDGRSDTASISVFGSRAQAPLTSVSRASAGKVDAGSQISIRSSVQANYSVLCEWSALIDGVSESLQSSTPQTRVFSEERVRSVASFPLLVGAGNFLPGSSVVFRLTATSAVDSSVLSFSDISVTLNAAPTGGSFRVSPATGVALLTEFSLRAADWLDDASDFPLSYSFSYHLLSPAQPRSIQLSSTANSVSSELPAGLDSLQNSVSCICTVADALAASTQVHDHVTVTPSAVDSNNSASGVVAYLESNFAKLELTYDSDSYFQVVNNVADTLNVVDCSRANSTFCSARNRDVCSGVPNTCSSCLSGFEGVAGPSNAHCFNATEGDAGLLGYSCQSDEECLLGECRESVCVDPVLTCPSSNETHCSGHGDCRYVDSNGNRFDEPCLVTQTSCSARCVCREGYGGVDCSVSPEVVVERSSVRSALCVAIIETAQSEDISFEVLRGLVSSLLHSFSPSEITSQNSSRCFEALTTVSPLVRQGLFPDLGSNTLSPFIGLLSDFVLGSIAYSAADEGPGVDVSAGRDGRSAVGTAVRDVLGGIAAVLVDGQAPVELTTRSLQMAVASQLSDAGADILLTSPPSDEQVAYGGSASGGQGITLVGGAAAACVDQSNYVRLSVVSWGDNPFPTTTSDPLQTPLLQIQTTPDSAVAARPSLASDTPQYYVSMQFSTKQDFNFSVSLEDILAGKTNETIPSCRLREGDDYVPCGSCSVSTYTNFNVTYACYDISEICGAGGRRSARDRRLQDQNPSLTTQFSTLFLGFEAQLQETLSMNPFDVTLAEAKVILSFLAGLAGFMLLVAYALRRQDLLDHHYVIYAKADAERRLVQWRKEKEKILVERSFGVTSASSKEFISLPLSAAGRSASLKRAMSYRVKNGRFSVGHAIATAFSFSRQVLPGARKQEMVQKMFAKHVAYGAVRAPALEWLEGEENEVREAATDYVDSVVKADDLLVQRHRLQQTMASLLRAHDYSEMFFEASLYNSRLTRWLNLCMKVLVVLFIDTLFYSSYYPDDGTCEALSSEAQCVAEENAVSGDQMCEWISGVSREGAIGGYCSFIAPPSDGITNLVITMMCVVIAAPLVFFYDFLFFQYASKRPDLQSHQLNAEFWLGRATSDSTMRYHRGSIPLVDARNKALTTADSVEEKSGAESEQMAQSVYRGALTAEEEAQSMLEEARDFHALYLQSGLTGDVQGPELLSDKATATRISELGLDVDWLPWREWLVHGDVRRKLTRKLEKTRRGVDYLKDVLGNMGQIDTISKDVALMQFFVLEQFSTLKRYALRSQIFSLADSTPEKIPLLQWLSVWLFVGLSAGFYFYWMFLWGLTNESQLLGPWGLVFLLAVAQDVLLIQMLKVYLMNVVSLSSIRPQLKYIYGVLHRLAMAYAAGDLQQPDSHFRVVHYLSPACRVANMHVVSDLAAAHLLRHVDDADVVVCRTNNDRRLTVAASLLISVPILAASLTPVLGDVALDVLLPCLSSSVLMLALVLYSFSVLALVIPLLGVLLFYLSKWRLRREHKRGHQLVKEEKLKETSERGQSSVNILEHSLSRRVIQSSRSLSSANLSLKSFYQPGSKLVFQAAETVKQIYTPRTEVERWDEQQWRLMNVPSVYITVPGAAEEKAPPLRLVRRDSLLMMKQVSMFRRDQTRLSRTVSSLQSQKSGLTAPAVRSQTQSFLGGVFNGKQEVRRELIPTAVLEMLRRQPVNNTATKATSPVKSKSLLGRLIDEASLQSVPVEEVDVFVESKSPSAVRLTRMKTVAVKLVVITDWDEAWDRIRSRFSNYIIDNKETEGSDSLPNDDLELTSVPVSALLEVTETSWRWFRPHNHCVSAEERAELVERFWLFVSEQTSSTSEDDVNTDPQEDTVSVGQYKKWLFYHVELIVKNHSSTLDTNVLY